MRMGAGKGSTPVSDGAVIRTLRTDRQRGVVPEAPLESLGKGLAPAGPGWFVLNAREARWVEGPVFGAFTPFENRESAKFEQVGINIAFLKPGQPACMYHREENQEDFLVLSGECLLLVEEEERQLKAWDFFHCPAGTDHVLVGAGEHGCTVIATGSRTKRAVVYPVSELARSHNAGVEQETDDPKEAYATFPADEEAEFKEEWLR
jgi:uncharacterized cupin superfamily protein